MSKIVISVSINSILDGVVSTHLAQQIKTWSKVEKNKKGLPICVYEWQ